MSWTEDVVGELARLKRAGMQNFDRAWEYAVDRYPVSGMVAGPVAPRLDDEEPIAAFVQRRCRLEWDGKVIDDFAAGLRALVESGHEHYVAAGRSVHSHARAALETRKPHEGGVLLRHSRSFRIRPSSRLAGRGCVR